MVARALTTRNTCNEISNVTDHELCAALTCLALAHQFSNSASDGSKAIALGDGDGIYLLPADIDESWGRAFICRSTDANFGNRSQSANALETVSVHVPELPRNEAISDAEYELRNGDCCTLILSDSGGVWQKHNPWPRYGCDREVAAGR